MVSTSPLSPPAYPILIGAPSLGVSPMSRTRKPAVGSLPTATQPEHCPTPPLWSDMSANTVQLPWVSLLGIVKSTSEAVGLSVPLSFPVRGLGRVLHGVPALTDTPEGTMQKVA